MKKSDLKVGNVLVDKNGYQYLFTKGVLSIAGEIRAFIHLKGDGFVPYNWYNENLEHCFDESKDISAVYSDINLNHVIWCNDRYKELKKIISCEEEAVIILLLQFGYKYIARDLDNELFFHTNEPHKNEIEWISDNNVLHNRELDELFEFVKFDDEKPYNMKELRYVKFSNTRAKID